MYETRVGGGRPTYIVDSTDRETSFASRNIPYKRSEEKRVSEGREYEVRIG